MANHEERHVRRTRQGSDPTTSNANRAVPNGEHHDHRGMGMRGVTRPMAERQFHQKGEATEHPHDTQHGEMAAAIP
jgi:hypothetical protein